LERHTPKEYLVFDFWGKRLHGTFANSFANSFAPGPIPARYGSRGFVIRERVAPSASDRHEPAHHRRRCGPRRSVMGSDEAGRPQPHRGRRAVRDLRDRVRRIHGRSGELRQPMQRCAMARRPVSPAERTPAARSTGACRFPD